MFLRGEVRSTSWTQNFWSAPHQPKDRKLGRKEKKKCKKRKKRKKHIAQKAKKPSPPISRSSPVFLTFAGKDNSTGDDRTEKTYPMNRPLSTCILLAALGLFSLARPAAAQLADRLYRSDYRINPERKGELRAEIDNISFFKDNEYAGSVMSGYSLPGLWVQPRLAYYPLANIKLEAGVHLLKYWGATHYPNMAYIDIARWQGRQYQRGVHILPFFRAQVALSDRLDIVLGNLYGGANHQLIDPLYTPELNLTADPEAGLQLLYHSPRFDLDAWVNWQSFIFRDDVHQEAFTVGLSTRVKLGRDESPWSFYIPLQALAQHRGGEIDTILSASVQTLMNGALGLGATWRPANRWLREVGAEADILGYYQQAGSLWPFESGTAWYARAWADVADFRVKAAYFQGDKFISMYGLPFYGAVSTKQPGLTYRHPKTGYIGLEYTYRFSPGYAIGAEVEVYYRFGGDALRPVESAGTGPEAEMPAALKASPALSDGWAGPDMAGVSGRADFSTRADLSGRPGFSSPRGVSGPADISGRADFSSPAAGRPTAPAAAGQLPASLREGSEPATAPRVVREGGATSFSAGVYLRICPSFLIKRFGGK